MNYVSEQERNERFKALKKKLDNQKCFDCSDKHPQWATVSFGILLCLDCSAKHRSYGPNISFVRSATMDNWREGEMYVMEEGGNKGFKEYLKKHNVTKVDYSSEVAQSYKSLLEQKAADAFKTSDSAEQQEQAKEHKPITVSKPREEPKVEEADKYNYETKNFQSKAVEVKKIDEQKEAAKPKLKKKIGLGGKKIAHDIDFNSLVVDDLQLQDKPLSNAEEPQKFALKKLDMAKKDEPASSKNKYEETSTAKPDLNKYKNYTGIGSDMLEAQQDNKVSIKNYNIGGGFGSDQLGGNDEDQEEIADTPFVYFARKVGNRVKATTSNLVNNIKDKMAK